MCIQELTQPLGNDLKKPKRKRASWLKTKKGVVNKKGKCPPNRKVKSYWEKEREKKDGKT